jgi:hypothetical protein
MARLGDPILCEGVRNGKTCGGHVFKCANPECSSRGCEKKGCSDRQFLPIQRCKDCGRTYERIQQFGPSKLAHDGEAGSTHAGRPISIPPVELIFGGVLGLAILGAVIAGMLGVFGGAPSGGVVAPRAPEISVSTSSSANPTEIAYTDICRCYHGGMDLAGKGVTVLDSTYRVGFIQCRAAFGPAGGDAWTAGWNARTTGKLIGAGCRSWMRGLGR